MIKVTAAGSMVLTRGWQVFARARGLSGWCTLHFRHDGAATLYVRVFGGDARRLGCCPESDNNGDDEVHPSDDDGQRGGSIPEVSWPLATTRGLQRRRLLI